MDDSSSFTLIDTCAMSAESTILHHFWKHTQTRRDQIALRVKRNGRYWDLTWDDFGRSVRHLSLALSELGVQQGDVVAILSHNRPEWAIADLAILTLGAISVSIYATHLPKDVAYVLNHSGAKVVVAEDQSQVEKILTVRSGVPALKKVLIIETTQETSDNDFMVSWSQTLKRGKELSRKEPGRIEHELSSWQRRQLAIVIYTSGTTGPPKGVLLTHDNLMFICETCSKFNQISDRDIFFSFLPLAHALERLGSLYFPVYLGAQVSYAERIETVSENLFEAAPTIVAGVPRFFEKIHQRVLATVASSSALKRALFHWSMRVGKQTVKHRVMNQRLPFVLHLKRQLADRLVYQKLRQRLGGRIRFFLSGGAPLSREIAEFFYALGLPIFEGYGATETSAPATVNNFEAFKFGTVGKPLPGVELKIAEDGEILIRGRNVFQGYYRDERATKEALVEGWYHTGDIGRIDDDGFLIILDRKKELIITSTGKNISPQNIEGLLKSDPLISQAVAIGDRRNYLTALLTLAPDLLAEWSRHLGLGEESRPELSQHPKIIDRVSLIVNKVNQQLARFEQIKKFCILPHDFTQATGELTPTMKLRRKFIAEKYAKEIARLYEERAVAQWG